MSLKTLLLAGTMLMAVTGVLAKGASGAACGAFGGSVAAGSVTLDEVSARVDGPGGFSPGADPAPIDRRRGGKVEVAAFGLG